MAHPVSSERASETLLHRLQVEITLSQRVDLRDQMWQLDLQSPFWRFYVNHRAGAFIICNGKRLELEPGKLTLIPAWLRFQTEFEEDGDPVLQDYIHFYVSGFPATLMGQLFDRPWSTPLVAPFDGLVQHWAAGLERTTAAGLSEFSWVYALVHCALARCVAELLEEKGRLANHWLREASKVWPALECIETRLAQPPTNTELASLCHVSTDHFVRQFRDSIGLTPAQYGLERRIAVAAQWLISSNQSIEEIAAAAGFTDRFHFSKVFKTRLEVSPVAYRKTHWLGT